jgi:glutathione S-transferase
MAVLLYDLPLSHYCVKVRRILDYKRIPYETEYAPYHDRQDLLAVSGQDYVPYLLWEDKGVVWHDIPDFLEAKQPTPTLYPDGQRGLAKILEGWAHEVVEEAAWKVVLNDAVKTFQDPREAWVFEEMQSRKRGPLEVMAMRKPEFVKGLSAALEPVEARFAEAPFLLGAQPSVADFALYGALHVLPYTGNEIPRDRPEVRAWFDRVKRL